MKKALLLLVFLFAASSMFAQISIGPQVGWLKLKDANEGTLQYGGALRINLSIITLEGSAAFSEKKYSDYAKSQSIPVSASAMLNVLPFVYACAGFDWYFDKYTLSYPGQPSVSENKTNTGYHIGAGVSISLGGVTLTGDARYMFATDTKISSANLNNNNLLLLVGLLFNL